MEDNQSSMPKALCMKCGEESGCVRVSGSEKNFGREYIYCPKDECNDNGFNNFITFVDEINKPRPNKRKRPAQKPFFTQRKPAATVDREEIAQVVRAAVDESCKAHFSEMTGILLKIVECCKALESELDEQQKT